MSTRTKTFTKVWFTKLHQAENNDQKASLQPVAEPENTKPEPAVASEEPKKTIKAVETQPEPQPEPQVVSENKPKVTKAKSFAEKLAEIKRQKKEEEEKKRRYSFFNVFFE